MSDEPSRGPRWLPWLCLGLLVLPFHTLWVDFEQVRRGLLLLLGGAALLAWPRLPHVHGERIAKLFVLALVLCAVVQMLLQGSSTDDRTTWSFQPWDAAYRIAHWCGLLVVVRLGAVCEPGAAALPFATTLLATSAFGLLQRLGVAEIDGYGVEREPVSTLGNLNVASEWTAIAATALAVLLPTLSGSWRRWLAFAALLTAGAYLVVNQSRSGLIALPIGLGLLFVMRRQQRDYLPLAVATTGALLGLLLTLSVARPQPVDSTAMQQELERGTATLAVRFEIARSTSQLFAESPVFGHGPGQFAVQYPRVRSQAEIEESSFGRQFATEVRNPHDDWLELLVDGGLPALVLFAAMLFALQRGTRDKTRLLPLFVLLLLMLVRSPVGNAPAVAAAFWLVGVRAEARRELLSWRRYTALALTAVLGLAMFVLGLLPLVGNSVFVPYVRARRDGTQPPIAAATEAGWWMPYEPRWLQIETQENLADGNLKRAAYLAARAIQLRPFDPQLRLNLAEVLARGARHGEALAVAKDALELDPANPELRVLQSTAYAQLGDVDRAIRSVVVDPHAVLRAQLANHFADIAHIAQTARNEPNQAARYLVEHHFVAVADRLGYGDAQTLKELDQHNKELGKALTLCERIRQDARFFVCSALLALDIDRPAIAIGWAQPAANCEPLPDWQRELLGPQLDRLAELDGWREYLARR